MAQSENQAPQPRQIGALRQPPPRDTLHGHTDAFDGLTHWCPEIYGIAGINSSPLRGEVSGKYPTLSFSHLDQYLCMVFAQLIFRESLGDIETCLRAHSTKLYHLGIRGGIARSTLADANEKRGATRSPGTAPAPPSQPPMRKRKQHNS